MDWLKQQDWRKIMVVALSEAAIGVLFQVLLQKSIDEGLVRDIGTVVILALVIVAGGLVLFRVLERPEAHIDTSVSSLASEPAQAEPTKPSIEFYANRSDMTAARGGLKKELEGVYVAWASWYSGTHATAEETFKTTHKPQKLLLLNPEGEFAQTIARLFLRPLHHFKVDVETTCDKALEAGSDVRLFEGPMTLMLIAEPESKSGRGWVRVEIAIPGSAVRPNIVIHQAAHPELFQEFVGSFKAVFGDTDTMPAWGRPSTPTPTPDTEGPRPPTS